MSTVIQEHEYRLRPTGDDETDFVGACTCGWESEATCRKHAGWLTRQHFMEAHPEQVADPHSLKP